MDTSNVVSTQIIAELSLVWKFYHTQIVVAPEINSFIASVNEKSTENSYTLNVDRVPDTERQVRGIFFILKGFISKVEDLSIDEIQIIKERVIESGIIPTLEELEAAQVNYQLFKQLRKQGIIPAE